MCRYKGLLMDYPFQFVHETIIATVTLCEKLLPHCADVQLSVEVEPILRHSGENVLMFIVNVD